MRAWGRECEKRCSFLKCDCFRKRSDTVFKKKLSLRNLTRFLDKKLWSPFGWGSIHHLTFTSKRKRNWWNCTMRWHWMIMNRYETWSLESDFLCRNFRQNIFSKTQNILFITIRYIQKRAKYFIFRFYCIFINKYFFLIMPKYAKIREKRKKSLYTDYCSFRKVYRTAEMREMVSPS